MTCKKLLDYIYGKPLVIIKKKQILIASPCFIWWIWRTFEESQQKIQFIRAILSDKFDGCAWGAGEIHSGHIEIQSCIKKVNGNVFWHNNPKKPIMLSKIPKLADSWTILRLCSVQSINIGRGQHWCSTEFSF
jgi:hypothetical protein